MEILNSKQSRLADSKTIGSGINGIDLMEKAGLAVTDAIVENYTPRYTVILCGPGNNGGDGFVIARILQERGWDVETLLYCDATKLKGDAKIAYQKWNGSTKEISIENIQNADLVVDAIFGTGLTRNIESKLSRIIEEVKNRRIDVIAVDIPSGVNSDNGEIMGAAFESEMTVTFARKKIGHVLYPSRRYCGKIIVADIGIKDEFITSDIFENGTELWLNEFPFPKEQQHKYDRGHAVIVGGGVKCTGAASLASVSALTVGAGIVTVACPKNALMVYATKLTSVMTKGTDNADEFRSFIVDKRINSILIGPGNGVNDRTKQFTLTALKAKKSCVIDADAITVFKDNPQELFEAIDSEVVLTPHEAEFARIFDCVGNKIERAIAASHKSGAIVIIKGADTIIASPDGRVTINTNAPPWLATAGSGDVLAGIICGLMAGGMHAYKAACAGVWIHSEIANIAGLGMISENMPNIIPKVLQGL